AATVGRCAPAGVAGAGPRRDPTNAATSAPPSRRGACPRDRVEGSASYPVYLPKVMPVSWAVSALADQLTDDADPLSDAFLGDGDEAQSQGVVLVRAGIEGRPGDERHIAGNGALKETGAID